MAAMEKVILRNWKKSLVICIYIDSFNRMHALTFGGKEMVEYSTVSDPELLSPSHAIVKITMAGVCQFLDLYFNHDRRNRA